MHPLFWKDAWQDEQCSCTVAYHRLQNYSDCTNPTVHWGTLVQCKFLQTMPTVESIGALLIKCTTLPLRQLFIMYWADTQWIYTLAAESIQYNLLLYNNTSKKPYWFHNYCINGQLQTCSPRTESCISVVIMQNRYFKPVYGWTIKALVEGNILYNATSYKLIVY